MPSYWIHKWANEWTAIGRNRAAIFEKCLSNIQTFGANVPQNFYGSYLWRHFFIKQLYPLFYWFIHVLLYCLFGGEHTLVVLWIESAACMSFSRSLFNYTTADNIRISRMEWIATITILQNKNCAVMPNKKTNILLRKWNQQRRRENSCSNSKLCA